MSWQGSPFWARYVSQRARAVLVLLVVAFAFAASTASADHGGVAPGKLLSVASVAAPRGALAWRIVYLSSTADGRVVRVSGLVVAPAGTAPRRGRNVVAWAHGTTGLTAQCGPSTVDNPARNLVNYFSFISPFGFDVGVPALTSFLAAGDVVVATDYQGLGTGTPGTHQYTVAGTLAHNVLDSVKAAHALSAAHAGLRTVVLGWSEGGGASLWSGQAADYGTPVRVLGTAALAPNADIYNQVIGAVKPGPTNDTAPSHEAALTMALWTGLKAAYPFLSLSQVLQPAGISQARGLAHQCIEHFANNVLETSVDNGWGLDPSRHLFLSPVPRVWAQTVKDNTPGYEPSKAPILVMQGLADTVINPNSTTQFVQRACGFRQPVEYKTYPGQTHQTIPSAAESEYLHWIAGRFDGRRAPSNC
jgi:alpha-beta hydrolase superfamily lysophospholipase